MRTHPLNLLGKYRDLVLAIALFLVIDVGVLAFNYFTSSLIEVDTARINTAGELRMYSQQLAKSVLSLRYEIDTGQPIQTSLAQISESHSAFEDSLARLERELRASDREFLGGNQSTRTALEHLLSLRKVWEPLAREANSLLELPGSALQPGSADAASNIAAARNVKVMQLAGELTESLEQSARERATAMRKIQLVAIVLAVLNFVFIVFKFVRSLRLSDRAAEAARRETSRILETVQEGLFLLDAAGRVGSQHSASLLPLFNNHLSAGSNFMEALRPRIAGENHESARDFIDLLFNQRIKPGLLKQLNPLREIAFARDDGEECFLDFEFEQVRNGDEVEYLLVSVVDVTEKVVLERELAAAENRARTEVDALLAVLEQDPHHVDAFLRTTEAKLAEINVSLARVDGTTGAYRELIYKTARVVHGVKGEAATLALSSIEHEIHRFEETLRPLLKRSDLNGEELIPVAVALNAVHEATAKVWRVVERVQRYAAGEQHSTAQERNELRELLNQIEHMTLRVAEDLNKKARLHVSAPTGISLPAAALDFLRSTLPQLVRNAVAHGIEPVEERLKKGKPGEGIINCSVNIEDDGSLNVQVHDDGAGLSAERLRQSMLARGLLSPTEAACLSDEQIVAKMFEPDFSALDEANLHAGRGEGLAVVKEAVSAIGGRMRISSRPETYTRFSMRLGKESWQCA